MKDMVIIESNTEPSTEVLWLDNGTLKYFGPNGWEEINKNTTSIAVSNPVDLKTSTSSKSVVKKAPVKNGK